MSSLRERVLATLAALLLVVALLVVFGALGLRGTVWIFLAALIGTAVPQTVLRLRRRRRG